MMFFRGPGTAETFLRLVGRSGTVVLGATVSSVPWDDEAGYAADTDQTGGEGPTSVGVG